MASRAFLVLTAALFLFVSSNVTALAPPTADQLAKYQRDGTLAERMDAAYQLGNHRLAPHLVSGPAGKDGIANDWNALPTSGRVKVFAMLIEFSDYPGTWELSRMHNQLFGTGEDEQFPYESLRGYYLRSSYGQLDLDGVTVGRYSAGYPRSEVTGHSGRTAVVREAIAHLDAEGHDFSPYDNDGDGQIEYFLVFWSGPPGDWADLWWAYLAEVSDPGFVVDGKTFGAYSWQWERWPGHPPTPWAAIHETGHALGLPDYYDYGPPAGPAGGVGTLDIMDGSRGDHNCFSKFILGWIDPVVYSAGVSDVALGPVDEVAGAALVMPGDDSQYPLGEYFMVEFRRQQGNDAAMPGSGLMVWHVHLVRTGDGFYDYLYNNNSTEHKLLRLMEADGLEEIEQDRVGDRGDYYRPGHVLSSETVPSSRRYDGTETGITLHSITFSPSEMSFRVSFDSACALSCEVEAPSTAWPRSTVAFSSVVGGCQGAGSLEHRWVIDGAAELGSTIDRVMTLPGERSWSFRSTLADSTCAVDGSVLVCSDPRCWQWQEVEPMSRGRFGHCVATLDDGRLLVAGGAAPPALYDPATGSWSEAASPSGSFAVTCSAVLFDDGRVLVVGSTPGDAVNAELYDPLSDSWQLTGQLAVNRIAPAVGQLADGRVVVAGGFWPGGDGDLLPVETEIFDPAGGTWRAVASIDEGMMAPQLTALDDGRLLLTGNHRALLFDPASESWRAAGDLSFSRAFHAAVRLDDGRVMVIGGEEPNQEEWPWRGEIFDPASEQWTPTAAPSVANRVGLTATLLASGAVLVTGGAGFDLAPERAVEIYDPRLDIWTTAAPLTEPRFFHTASELGDGSVLVVGGTASDGTLEWQEWVGSRQVERFAQPSVEAPPPRRARGRLR